MTPEDLQPQWEYFLGSWGNERDLPRKGSQWFNEAEGGWQKCYEDDRHLFGQKFIPNMKYRRRVP